MAWKMGSWSGRYCWMASDTRSSESCRRGSNTPSISDLPYGYLPIKATGIWVPLALTPQQKGQRLGGAISHLVVARLRPGVSVKEAQSDMSTVMARLDQLYQPGARGWGALVGSFMDKAV